MLNMNAAVFFQKNLNSSFQTNWGACFFSLPMFRGYISLFCFILFFKFRFVFSVSVREIWETASQNNSNINLTVICVIIHRYHLFDFVISSGVLCLHFFKSDECKYYIYLFICIYILQMMTDNKFSVNFLFCSCYCLQASARVRSSHVENSKTMRMLNCIKEYCQTKHNMKEETTP